MGFRFLWIFVYPVTSDKPYTFSLSISRSLLDTYWLFKLIIFRYYDFTIKKSARIITRNPIIFFLRRLLFLELISSFSVCEQLLHQNYCSDRITTRELYCCTLIYFTSGEVVIFQKFTRCSLNSREKAEFRFDSFGNRRATWNFPLFIHFLHNFQ